MTKLRNILAAFLAFQLLTHPYVIGRTRLADLFRPKTEEDVPETEPEEEDFTPKRGRFAPDRRKKGRHGAEETGGTGGLETLRSVLCEAREGQSFSWYAPHQKNGTRPAAPAEIPSVEEHGGCFLGADEPVVYLTLTRVMKTAMSRRSSIR